MGRDRVLVLIQKEGSGMDDTQLQVQMHHIEQMLAKLVAEDPKQNARMVEMMSELKQIKEKLTLIKEIVIGADGGNGLRSEVRHATLRVDTLEKIVEKIIADETTRNTWIAEWGWKVLAAFFGFLFALPGLIETLAKLKG